MRAMLPSRIRLSSSLIALLLLVVGVAQGQASDPMPPPLPSPPPPEEAKAFDDVFPVSDLPWRVPGEILEALARQAVAYAEYTRRFTCDETARVVEYSGGEAKDKEKERRYGYLLVKDPTGETLREYRQLFAKDGSLKPGEVEDSEPFPPAYAWVYLFSRFHEPYFALRYLGERFDGFDWVHEIQFKGSLPFTDGKDIRQWEGVVLVDAVTHTPLEIVAQPTGQLERIEAVYRKWKASFNIMGWRSGPKPLGYKSRIDFRLRRDGLTFPTQLRYDTIRAVSRNEIVPVEASIRTYDHYRFTEVLTEQAVGETGEE